MSMLLRMLTWIKLLYLAWIVSIVGLLGSLIYSELLFIPICPLCWYQRIAMYPLVIIFGVGILFRDKNCVYYSLPLVITGILISLYQVLLQASLIPNILAGCNALGTVPCAQVTFKLFGFLTIPQQALLGFLSIGILNIRMLAAKE